MQKNVGSIDRNIRIALGAIFLVIGLFAQISTGLRTGAFVIAAIALVTAFSGFWPIWKVLGISTLKEKITGKTGKPAGH